MKFDDLFHPMLLSERKCAFDSIDYLFEMKFDGVRALIYVSPTFFKIVSRQKKDITFLYPELKKIQHFVRKPTIFDGEIVLFFDGVPNFSKLQERIHLKNENVIQRKSLELPVVFMCFDILYLDGDLCELSLMNRKEVLNQFKDTDEFIPVPYVFQFGISFFEKIKQMNLEGIVAKKLSSPYEINTRSLDWIKIKNLKMDSFLVGGFIEGKSKSMFSVFLGEYVKDSFVFVGRVSVSLNSELFSLLKKEKKLKQSVFTNYECFGAFYILPKYSCSVRYLERSKKGILRHPVFCGFTKV